METSTAVVIGAGIGGLTAANALRRRGWHVTILERADELRPIGAGIALAPNAMHGFDAIDLGDRVRAAGAYAGMLGARRRDGRWIFSPRDDFVAKRYGYPLYIHLRAELLGALAAELAPESIRFGQEVVTVEPGDADRRARVITSDGTEYACRLVVAAGGRSAVRVALFPAHPGPAYGGYRIWWMVAPGLGEQVIANETYGRGGLFGLMPLRAGRLYAYATMLTAPEREAGDPLTELRSHVSGWHTQIKKVLDAVDPESVFSDGSRWMREPLPRYHAGRVALLGDAAHPMTPDLGQGGCQAVEDAVVLARVVGDDPDRVPEALADYTAARVPRTMKIVRRSHGMARFHHVSNPLAVKLRDRALWLGGKLPIGVALRAYDPVFGWRP